MATADSADGLINDDAGSRRDRPIHFPVVGFRLQGVID
jgi:hypothetical protein